MSYALPVLYALFLWWFSTGAVLYVIGLPRPTFRWSMSAATAVGLWALYALFQSGGSATVTSAYVGFTAALLVWGWHEMSFLTGLVTGPRTSECPPHKSARAPLWPAVETLLYHEAAILITGLGLYGLLADTVNPAGWLTFLVLWTMRLSAKFNVYLGVPNLTEEFLPPHLRYLKSYFCRRPMNLLFPISITVSTVATVYLVQAALAPDASDYEVTSAMLLATLMFLAVIEHWFLVIPVPAASLWTWGLASREDGHGFRPAPEPRTLEPRSVRDGIDAKERITVAA